MNSVGAPIVGPDDATALVTLGIGGGGEAHLWPALVPTLAQGRVQTHAGFVHKQ
jgi:hypothetical protein